MMKIKFYGGSWMSAMWNWPTVAYVMKQSYITLTLSIQQN